MNFPQFITLKGTIFAKSFLLKVMFPDLKMYFSEIFCVLRLGKREVACLINR